MPTILLKKSDTPGSVPGTANLTNLAGGAEVAVNTADKRMFSMTSASAVVELGTNPSSLTCADGSFVLLKAASASITNLTATSLVLSNLSIASANITTLTSASATITNLLGTTLTISGNSFLATSSGNVGIGTTSPAQKLHVAGNSQVKPTTGTDAVWTRTSNDSGEFYLGTDNSAGTGFTGTAYARFLYATGAYPMTFHTNNLERARITSGGDVGIGTSSPGSLLDVYKDSGTAYSSANILSMGQWARISNPNTTSGTGVSLLLRANASSLAAVSCVSTAASNSAAMTFAARQSDGTLAEQMRLDSSGNLGLGVTPSAWNSGAKAFDIANGAVYAFSSSNNIALASNAFYNASNNWIYKQSSQATLYAGEAGQHRFFTAASGTAGNTISFTQAMTLDASGFLGIGTSSPTRLLSINAPTSTQAWTGYGQNGTEKLVVGLDASGNGNFLVTANAPAIFSTNNTERARITSGGDLCVQATSAVFNSANRGNITIGGSASSMLFLGTGNGTGSYVFHEQSTAGMEVWNTANGYIRFATNATERARITSGGYFKASNTGGYDSATGTYHELLSNDADDYILIATHFGATNPQGFAIQFTTASPDNNTQVFLRCADNTTARCIIYSDGDLANHDGVYGTISDERLKQDIVDAGSQWDDLKAVRFRKYRMKTDVEADPNAPALLGVVAQELEQVCPGLVDEHPDMEMVEVTDEEGNVTQTQQPTGTTTKTVKSSILLMKAAVALQEAMARIEKLEAEVAALKGA